MKIRIAKGTSARAELAVVLVAEGATPDAGAAWQAAVARCKATGDLKTGFRKVSLFHATERGAPRRLGFVGLGKAKEVTAEKLRRAAAVAQAAAEEAEVAKFQLVVGDQVRGAVTAEAAGTAVAEGLILGAYAYQPPSKEKSKTRKGHQCDVTFLGKDQKVFARGFALGEIGARATVFARDLGNLPGNRCTPSRLAAEGRKLAHGSLRVKVLDRRAMERLKMNALLGVARGSDEPPKLIILDYRPPGAKSTVCIVGKGLTFDTGGISIKPASKMDEMRYDMCGGGAVLGLFHAIRHGALKGSKGKTRIVGVIPSTENMPGSSAQKPGDVVRAMDGHTIEVLNTDAEGRLILADGIAYARKFYQPKKMVDLATLTGAVVVALGHEMAGIMGNDDELAQELMAAGKQADEPLWQLPLWEHHMDQVKSKFADVANINGAQYGCGSIAGAALLSVFAGDTPWVHLDIAGAAWGGIQKDYYRGGAAGTAVRTLLHWVRSL